MQTEPAASDANPSPLTPFPTRGRIVAVDLPSPTSPLVGRQHQVAELGALLRDPANRLVTLVGPGGVGKTRLAIEVAAESADIVADRVAFVGLADVHDPELVAPTIARRLEIEETGDRLPRDRLIAELRQRSSLLVVDNLEHLLPAALLLADLLAACPNLKILATSRARLRLTGERVVPVEPLALPDLAALPPAAEMTSFGAVRLWVERAQAANPAFSLTAANAPIVATICHRLDGLPLAIELAAAWARLLPPESILRRLERRLHLLTDGPRDAPTRLQTMREAIAWSYDLLDPAERLLFARLAAFTGGFTTDAAEDVSRGVEESRSREENVRATHASPLHDSSHPEDTRRLLDAISALVDKELLQRRTNAEGEPRLAMLETVREFGLEQLARSGEEDAVRDAHAASFLAFAEAAGPAIRADQTAWFRTEADIGNLRSALAWLRDRGRIDDALRLVNGLGWFWTDVSYVAEGRGWYDGLLAAEGQRDAGLRARALLANADLADLHGDGTRSVPLYEEGLALARSLGEAVLVRDALTGLASASIGRSLYVEAEASLTEALALAEEIGDPWPIGRVLSHLGNVAVLQGDWQRAVPRFEQALRTWRVLSDHTRIVAALNSLGWSHLVGGDLPRAWESYDAALTLLVENDFEPSTIYADCYVGVALIAGADGASQAATRLVAAAAALRARLGMPARDQVTRLLEARAAEWEAALGSGAFAKTWVAGSGLEPAAALAEARAVPKPAAFDASGLSRRERDVLRLLVDGASDVEIADKLFISRRTASSHVASIIEKLGVTNRTAAATLAVRRRIV